MGQPNIIVPLALVCTSDAVSGWAGLALDHPEFGSSVNLISTKGGGGRMQIMPTTLLIAHPDLKKYGISIYTVHRDAV